MSYFTDIDEALEKEDPIPDDIPPELPLNEVDIAQMAMDYHSGVDTASLSSDDNTGK